MRARLHILSIALAIVPAVAQDDLDAVLAAFPDDGLPALLQRLGEREDRGAVAALAALGPRAHRFLFGLVRSPLVPVHRDLAPAFGDFGPCDGWVLPGLLEMLPDDHLIRTVPGLLERLGPTAAPAVAVLRGRGDERGDRLADALAKSAGTAPANDVRSLPVIGPAVAERWREPLLLLLADEEQNRRWWPALQAAMAVDDETAARAAAILARHALAAAPIVAEAARQLLVAECCWYAAIAVRDPIVLKALPDDLELREARRFVLAAMREPARIQRQPAYAQEVEATALQRRHAIERLAAAREPGRRLLAVLHVAIAVALAPDVIPAVEALRPLAADPVAEIRALAAIPLARADAALAEVFAQAIVDVPAAGERIRALEQLDAGALSRLPPARLRELIALLPPAPAPRLPTPAKEQGESRDLAKQLLQATRDARPGVHAYQARSLLVRLARTAPGAILAADDLPASERAALLAVVLTVPDPAPELLPWLLDALGPPPAAGDRSAPHLPPGLADLLLARLRAGDRVDDTVGWLARSVHYLDWAEKLDAAAADLERAARVVSPARYEDYARLFAHGDACRRALERLLLADTTPPALREALLRPSGTNVERFPPTGAFVLRLLDHPDDKLRAQGVWLAGHARDRREELAARLLPMLDGADEDRAVQLAMTLARLGATAALPRLAERLPADTPRTVAYVACAMLDLDADDAAAPAALRRLLDGGADARQWAWKAISFSPTASLRFLDEAMTALTDGQDGFRLVRLLETAASRDRARGLAALEQLARRGDHSLASYAEQTLRRLREER